MYQPDATTETFFDLDVVSQLPADKHFDRVLLTSLEQTNELTDKLLLSLTEQQIIIPSFLSTAIK